MGDFIDIKDVFGKENHAAFIFQTNICVVYYDQRCQSHVNASRVDALLRRSIKQRIRFLSRPGDCSGHYLGCQGGGKNLLTAAGRPFSHFHFLLFLQNCLKIMSVETICRLHCKQSIYLVRHSFVFLQYIYQRCIFQIQ